MQDLEVIDQADVAAAVLDPVRAKILAVLTEPGTATTVARTLGMTRQKVNYHLRTLEAHDLVRLVEERPRRGLTERVVIASARSYVLSSDALGNNAADPARTDRLSAHYLIAIAARIVREVAILARRAQTAGRPLATLTIDTEIRFVSAAQRAAFTVELTDFVTSLAARYHDERSPSGRWHRLVIGSHPLLTSAAAPTQEA